MPRMRRTLPLPFFAAVLALLLLHADPAHAGIATSAGDDAARALTAAEHAAHASVPTENADYASTPGELATNSSAPNIYAANASTPNDYMADLIMPMAYRAKASADADRPSARAVDPPADRGPFALVNCRVVTVTNGVIEGGTVLIRDGLIAEVGAGLAAPGGAERVDCRGASVYPGLIDAGTRLGLAEIGAVHETLDYGEVGDVIPQMDALTAVNPNSVLIPVTRVNGVTTVLTEPAGALMPGTAALINLHGYTPEQMHLGGVKTVLLNFPVSVKTSRWDRRTDEEREKAHRERMKTLNEMWDRAELYARIDSAYQADSNRARPPEYAPSVEALLPVLRGERHLLIHADHATTITESLDWAEERGILKQVILTGVLEGWRVANEIAEKDVPALVGPVLDLPGRASDRYDKAYVNAGLLHDAGVRIAIRTGETENVRNLPYHAGFAAAYGLGQDDALRAVTIDAAAIFGVDHLVGSIEAGKVANLFIADGDPFETRTQIQDVFINGYRIPMESRQTRLYEEFLRRDP